MTRANWGLTLLIAGGVASMPVVMVGHILAETNGAPLAIAAILVGNVLLCAVGCLNAHLAIKYRTTTSDTVGRVGGESLSKIFSIAMIVSMLGWFTVQCSVLVVFAQGYWPDAPHTLLAFLLAASLIATTMGDIKRLLWLSERVGPLLLLACVAMFVLSSGDAHWTPRAQESTPLLPALSLVLATSLGVAIDVPTYYRFASSRKEAFASLFIVIWLITSTVQVLGVMLLGQYTLTQLIASPFGIVMAMSGWLMNVNNLYSAVVSSQTLVKRGSFALRTIMLGSIALIIVCLQLSDSIATSIEAITLGISSMGGVLVACVLLREQAARALTLSWMLGVVVGVLTLTNNLVLTSAAQIDAFAVAAVFSTMSLLGVKLWQSQLSMNNN